MGGKAIATGRSRPSFVFERAHVAETLWTYVAAAVAFDTVEEMFLPESQLFRLTLAANASVRGSDTPSTGSPTVTFE